MVPVLASRVPAAYAADVPSRQPKYLREATTRKQRDLNQKSAMHGRATGLRHGGGGSVDMQNAPPLTMGGHANPLGGASPGSATGGFGGPFASLRPGALAGANSIGKGKDL